MINVALLTIGFLGLVVAALTPRSKTGTAIALISFAGYFFMNEHDEWYTIIIFILGISLLIFEVFIPDFGIAGILGILLIILGLYQTLGDLTQAIRDISIAFLISIGLVVVLARRGYTFENFSKLVLNTDLNSNRGFLSGADHSALLGKMGTTVTGLRPTGKAVFGDITVDVLSEGEPIEKESEVEVIKVEGSKIVVRRVV